MFYKLFNICIILSLYNTNYVDSKDINFFPKKEETKEIYFEIYNYINNSNCSSNNKHILEYVYNPELNNCQDETNKISNCCYLGLSQFNYYNLDNLEINKCYNISSSSNNYKSIKYKCYKIINNNEKIYKKKLIITIISIIIFVFSFLVVIYFFCKSKNNINNYNLLETNNTDIIDYYENIDGSSIDE